MEEFFIKIYVKMKYTCIWWMNVIKILKFSLFLYKGNIFRDGNPELVLVVIKKYLELEKDNYRQTIVHNRDVNESSSLFSALVSTYLEEGSSVVLKQAMSVLENEFIKREKKSGKA